MYKCRTKTFFKFNKLSNLINEFSLYDMITIISDNFVIHTDILGLKSDLWFLLNLEVQVFEDKPLTFYL